MASRNKTQQGGGIHSHVINNENESNIESSTTIESRIAVRIIYCNQSLVIEKTSSQSRVRFFFIYLIFHVTSLSKNSNVVYCIT